MEKVLILSYFYPPCNLTAGQRPYSWAKYLHEYGYYPVVITRNWDREVATYVDMARDSGDEDQHVIHETHEVWYLKFRGNLRDRLYVRWGEDRMIFARRALTFFELLLQNFTIRHIGYANMYNQARKILRENPDLKKLVVCANPYIQFYFAYLLKKEFPRLQWVADYRDDWTTTGIQRVSNPAWELIYRLERRSEKKWVSTASCITSVSSHYVQKISSFLNIPGYVLPNGYADDVYDGQLYTPEPSKFVITYSGTLYDRQPIEKFIDAFIVLCGKYENKIKMVFQCIGLAIDRQQEQRVRSLMKGFEDELIITKRIPRAEANLLQKKSNLLLLLGQEVKGNIASKLYSYIGMRKKVLFFGSEDDTMAEPLQRAGVAVFCKDTDEIIKAISMEIEHFLQNPQFSAVGNEEEIQKYSRKNQVKILAQILDSL